MNNDDRNGLLSLASVVFFILGGLVGAVLGIMFAPQSGAETRKKLRETASGLGDKAIEVYDTTKTKVEKLIEHGRDICCSGDDETPGKNTNS